MGKESGAKLSIFSNTLLIILKITAGLTMHSVSVISEAIHSSIDLLASIIAFISIKIAVKPEDADHQYGHGKYENISGFVEALLIFLAAVIIIYEAVQKMIKGVHVENLGAGILVMGISAAVNLIISLSLLKISKKTGSIALEADAMHLLTDVLTALGVFVGLIFIKITNFTMLDPVIAIFVSLIIIRTSYNMTKKSMLDLVDTSLPKDEINIIDKIVKSDPNVYSYHALRTRKSGPNREIELHLLIDSSLSLEETHKICDEIENKINSVFPNSYTMVHAEPYEKDTVYSVSKKFGEINNNTNEKDGEKSSSEGKKGEKDDFSDGKRGGEDNFSVNQKGGKENTSVNKNGIGAKSSAGKKGG